MELIIIAAMAENRVIGRERALPWKIPEEYEHFLGFVRGHTVVMGRTSYEIFGPDLTESNLVVVSRKINAAKGVRVFPRIESALEHACSNGERVFIAGGASIYQQTLAMADAMYLSVVKGEFEGDTFFPAFGEDDWNLAKAEDHEEFEFRVYESRRAPDA